MSPKRHQQEREIDRFYYRFWKQSMIHETNNIAFSRDTCENE